MTPPTPRPPSSAVVEKYSDELVELRRDLHAHPELSWHEERTTDLVADPARRSRAAP